MANIPRQLGLMNPDEYDIKDTNIELIGSRIDHKVKYNSAVTEPAWNDGKVGLVADLFIWRIEQFEVVPWPKAKYGTFYDGDSFIVLRSYRIGDKDGNEKLAHDIFFWLGSHTSQDEAGTAAYKTAELDEFLRGTATQHREVQVTPSNEFLALFPRLSIRKGGIRSGFRHVEEESRDGRLTLLRLFKNPVAGANGVVVVEVEPVWRSLDDGDVFVLDQGHKIWVWQGKNCSPMEKGKAAQVVHEMTVAKHADIEVISQSEFRSKRIIDLLGGDRETPRVGFNSSRPLASGNQARGGINHGGAAVAVVPRRLFRLSDATGELMFELVQEGGRISRNDLGSSDIFLFDDGGKALWVWEGSGASATEKKWWYRVTQKYLRCLEGQMGYEGAYMMPLGKVAEGSESRAFLKAIGV